MQTTQQQATHTPGPWRAQEWSCHAATTVVTADHTAVEGKRIVAECEFIDEARLIAAAPELLVACQALIAYCDKNPPMGDSLWSVQLIRAAITKATQAQAEVAA